MMCPEEKLITAEITFFLNIQALTVTLHSFRGLLGVWCVHSARPHPCLLVRDPLLWLPIITTNRNLSGPVDSQVKVALRERWLVWSGSLVSHSIG